MALPRLAVCARPLQTHDGVLMPLCRPPLPTALSSAHTPSSWARLLGTTDPPASAQRRNPTGRLLRRRPPFSSTSKSKRHLLRHRTRQRLDLPPNHNHSHSHSHNHPSRRRTLQTSPYRQDGRIIPISKSPTSRNCRTASSGTTSTLRSMKTSRRRCGKSFGSSGRRSGTHSHTAAESSGRRAAAARTK